MAPSSLAPSPSCLDRLGHKAHNSLSHLNVDPPPPPSFFFVRPSLPLGLFFSPLPSRLDLNECRPIARRPRGRPRLCQPRNLPTPNNLTPSMTSAERRSPSSAQYSLLSCRYLVHPSPWEGRAGKGGREDGARSKTRELTSLVCLSRPPGSLDWSPLPHQECTMPSETSEQEEQLSLGLSVPPTPSCESRIWLSSPAPNVAHIPSLSV